MPEVGDQALEGHPSERFKNNDGMRPADRFISTHQVRMTNVLEDPAFPKQSSPRLDFVKTIRPEGFGNAVTIPLLTPHLVGINGSAAAQVFQDSITGCEELTLAQRRNN